MSPSAKGVRVDLDGRVALVTGSSRGLGSAAVARLAAMGAVPVVTYHSAESDARVVAEKIRSDGGRCFVHPLDMGSTASIEALFDWLVGSEGPGALDILVANAAATSFKPLLAVKPHNVEKTFAISVTGFLTAVQRAVPLMKERGGGRIVAVSGGDTKSYGPVHGLLAAAKASMETLVRYLQVELHGTGVTAIGINPYAFRSDSTALQFGAVYERLMRALDALHPRGAIPEADDVAEVVALCCTDAATWLAGDTLGVDGGGAFALGGKFVQFALSLPPDVLDAATSRGEGSAD